MTLVVSANIIIVGFNVKVPSTIRERELARLQQCAILQSSYLPVRQYPGANLGFQDLTDLGARKIIPDFDLLWRFDAPD